MSFALKRDMRTRLTNVSYLFKVAVVLGLISFIGYYEDLFIGLMHWKIRLVHRLLYPKCLILQQVYVWSGKATALLVGFSTFGTIFCNGSI